MNQLLRTSISMILAMATVLVVYCSMPSYSFAPQGIVLPRQGINQPFQGVVKVFNSEIPPLNATVLGSVSVEFHNVNSTARDQEIIVNKARELARTAGGNGLVYAIGHSSIDTPSNMAMLVLKGTVIKSL